MDRRLSARGAGDTEWGLRELCAPADRDVSLRVFADGCNGGCDCLGHCGLAERGSKAKPVSFSGLVVQVMEA